MKTAADLPFNATQFREITNERVRRRSDDRAFSMALCTLAAAERDARGSSVYAYLTKFAYVQCGPACTIAEANEALDIIRSKGFSVSPGPIREGSDGDCMFDIDADGKVLENGRQRASALNIIVSWESVTPAESGDVVNMDSTPQKESNACHLRDPEPQSQPNPVQRSGTGWLLALLSRCGTH